jgi:hypothetical protein
MVAGGALKVHLSPVQDQAIAARLEPRAAEPSIINEKTIADFTRVVEPTGILERQSPANKESVAED